MNGRFAVVIDRPSGEFSPFYYVPGETVFATDSRPEAQRWVRVIRARGWRAVVKEQT